VADHNAAAAAAGTPGIAPRTGGMAIPDFTVNEYVVKQDDLSLGNAIASCFVGYSDFINRLRESHGMGGRAMISTLKVQGAGADPAEKALVIRQFTMWQPQIGRGHLRVHQHPVLQPARLARPLRDEDGHCGRTHRRQPERHPRSDPQDAGHPRSLRAA
jgi:hypothetical protein